MEFRGPGEPVCRTNDEPRPTRAIVQISADWQAGTELPNISRCEHRMRPWTSTLARPRD
jgi:hypothetical protein